MKNLTIRRAITAIALLAMSATGLFTYSVLWRSPWFGSSPVCPETWLQAATVLSSRIWYQEGAIRQRFGLFEEPTSIEHPTQASRKIYSSYPPGVAIPIYAIARLLHRDPSLKLVMAYGLFCQWFVAITASLTVFLLIRRMRNTLWEAVILAHIPLVAILFLPSPFFEFQMCYLPDTAALPLFSLYILLEAARDATDRPAVRRWYTRVQGILAFFGVLTDWLFVFAAFCLYLKRITDGEMTSCPNTCGIGTRTKRFILNSASFSWPVIAPLALFIVQLHYFGQFAVIASRFRERTGLHTGHFSHFSFNNLFWNTHLVRGFGPAGRYAAIGCLAIAVLMVLYAGIRAVFRKPVTAPARSAIAIMFLSIVPCVIQVCLFPQHVSLILHFFAATRFTIPLALIPLALFPATLLASDTPAWRIGLFRLLAPILLLTAAAYTYMLWPEACKQFLPPPHDDPVEFGSFIHGNTAYEDVCFTPHSSCEIGHIPPVPLAYSLKEVYPAHRFADFQKVLAPISGEYIVNIVIRHNEPPPPPDVQALLAGAYHRDENGKTALYKIRKADFVRIAEHGS